MSLRPDPIGPVPEETMRVAKAVFRKGNLCLRLREVLGTIYEDGLFSELFSTTRRPAEALWRLALITHLKDNYLPAQYHRLTKRLGKAKAVTAVSHSILVMKAHHDLVALTHF